MGSGAQEDGAEGDIEHEGEEEDAEAKRPGGGLVVEVVEPVHEVVDVDVGADGDERVEAVLGHLVLEGRATQPRAKMAGASTLILILAQGLGHNTWSSFSSGP